MTSLRTKLWIVFIVILAVSQTTAVVGVWDLVQGRVAADTGGARTSLPAVDPPPDRSVPLGRMAVACALALLVGGGLTYGIGRSVTVPLETIGRAAERMVDGRLDQPIATDRRHREVARIGEGINDLAMNLQEALLFVWKRSDGAMKRLDTVHRELSQCRDGTAAGQIAGDIDQARREIEEIQAMVRSFRFYGVDLGRSAILSREKPGSGSA